MVLSPHDIKFLLHGYLLQGPWPVQSDAATEVKENFLRWGVIIPEEGKPDSFKTTQCGDAWVHAICNVPMPRAIFVDAQGKEIVP